MNETTGSRSGSTAVERLIADLDDKQVDLLADVADALRTPIQCNINPESDICSDAFVDDFTNRLKLYHALNEEPLKKKTFEYAFVRSLSAAGRHAFVNENYVNPGEDATIDGVAYSLKTEAAKSISKKNITISKLMEARWVRECQIAEEYADGIAAKVIPHLQRYERVIILRALARGTNHYEYRLIEIPIDILISISDVGVSDFVIKKSTVSAPVYFNGKKAFTLSLDLSVEKITVRTLPERICTHHATFVVPTRSVVMSTDTGK